MVAYGPSHCPIVTRNPHYTFHCLILAQSSFNGPHSERTDLNFIPILFFVPQSSDPHTTQSGLYESPLCLPRGLEASGSQENQLSQHDRVREQGPGMR